MGVQIQAIGVVPHGIVLHHIEHDKGASRTGIAEAAGVSHVDLSHPALQIYAEVVGMTTDIGGDTLVYQCLPKTIPVGLMSIQ